MPPSESKSKILPFVLTFGAGCLVGALALKAFSHPEPPSPAAHALGALAELSKTGLAASAELTKNPEVAAARDDLLKTGMSLIGDSMKREMAEKKAEAERRAALTPAERRAEDAAKREADAAKAREAMEAMKTAGQLMSAGTTMMKAANETTPAGGATAPARQREILRRAQALNARSAAFGQQPTAEESVALMNAAAAELERSQTPEAVLQQTQELQAQLEATQRLLNAAAANGR